jgi:hypothetical protein
MRWNQGRSQVDRLIADGELQRVPANREHADQLLVQARKDLTSAELLLDTNPKRAYESIYDAARMALTAWGPGRCGPALWVSLPQDYSGARRRW